MSITTRWTPFQLPRIDPSQAVMGHGAEQRRSLRLPLPAASAVCEYDGRRGLYDIINVSAEGLLIEGRPPLPEDALCSVRVLTTQIDPFVVLGRVVYTLPPGGGNSWRAGLTLDVRDEDVHEQMRQLVRAAMAFA